MTVATVVDCVEHGRMPYYPHLMLWRCATCGHELPKDALRRELPAEAVTPKA